MVATLLEKNEELLKNVVDALNCADEENQQGILNFLADRQDMGQKWSWQLRSSLGIKNG
jgi:DNA-binding ferritin-like protein